MFFKAHIVQDPEDRQYYVSFPVFPDINTHGKTLDDAQEMAADALNSVLEGCDAKALKKMLDLVGADSRITGNDFFAIPVEPQIALPYVLKKLRGHRSQTAVAAALKITPQSYNKYELPKSNASLKTLAKLSRYFGRELYRELMPI